MPNPYNHLTPEGLAYLAGVTAPDRVLYGNRINEEYTHDEMPQYGHATPETVVLPETAREVSAVMQYAWANNIPVTPRGAGTGLSGGAVAICGGIMLCLSRMNHILGIDRDNMTIDVEPGVLLLEVARAAAQEGLLYPPDPGEKTATIGGTVMSNAGGMRAVRYGVTREYVRALEVVLADGSIVALSSNVAKNTSGYDLKDLLIGSEGTLGVVTRITLRLIQMPRRSISLVVPYDTLEQCIDTVPHLFKADLLPTAIEFFQRDMIEASEKYLNKLFPDKTSDSYLVLMFDGTSKAEVEAWCDEAAEVCLRQGALDVLICDTDERKAAVWSMRGACLEALKSSTSELDELDIVVPRNTIAVFIKFARQVSDRHEVRINMLGHAGDGNIHVALCRDELTAAEWGERRPRVIDELYAKARDLGGQVSGEHGIGHIRIEPMRESLGERTYQLFLGIKSVFDSKNILNPGKIVRLGE